MGDNYGLNDNYEYTEYWLDSLDNSGAYATGYPATDWPLFQFGNISIDKLVAIKILDWQIPFSWYVFTTVNQNFTLNETGFASGIVTIPVGNYTAAVLTGIMKAALDAASVTSGSANIWTVTYSAVTQKFTFVSSVTSFSFGFGSAGGTLDINGLPVAPNTGNRNPRLWIGFPAGTTASIGTTLIAPNSDLVSGPNYLYLNSRTIGAGVRGFLPAGAINFGVSGPNIAKIPVNVNPGGIVIGSDPAPLMWFYRDSTQAFSSLDLYLTLGNLGSNTATYPLPLNGIGFSVKIGMLLRIQNDTTDVQPTFQNGRVTQSTGPKKRQKNLF